MPIVPDTLLDWEEAQLAASDCVTAPRSSSGIRERVAAELKAALVGAGLTQAAAAASLGISEAAMSHRLSGRRNLGLESIEEIAALAGKTVRIVFQGNSNG